MTANHSPDCPARVSTRYGCSCLLRQTSSTGPASSYPPPRVLPTSVAPAGEGYGAPADSMLDGITRYTMLVEVDYMGFGAGIAAEPNPDGGWINAADLPALLEQARADAEQRVSEAILLEYATNMPTRTYEQGQRDERERIDSAVMPIIATLARHACTAENWEQTDALTRRSVTDVKAAIRAREEKPNG